MKKVWIVFLGMLLGLASCVYLGLFPNEVEKHNTKIKEQIKEFPFENFDVEFYYFPNEKKEVTVNCINGVFELLVFENGKMYYNYAGEEKCYDFDTKEEITYQKAIKEYSYIDEARRLVSIIQNYDELSDKTDGRRGMKEDEDGVLDEINHYFYDMDWEYLDIGCLSFYVTEKTSKIKSMFFEDNTNDLSLDRRHFAMHVYLESNEEILDLKESYEYQIRVHEEAESEENM